MIPPFLKKELDNIDEYNLVEKFKKSLLSNNFELFENMINYKRLKESVLFDFAIKNLPYLASESNNIMVLKYVLNSKILGEFTNYNKEIDKIFCTNCALGNIKILEYLLNSKDIKENVKIYNNPNALIVACENNQLETVKYLLSSTTLIEHSNIHSRFEAPLINSCEKGHLEIIKYLISEDLNDKANIYYGNGEVFLKACEKGHLKILEFLLNIPEFFKFIKSENNYIHGFIAACKNEYIEIIEYLMEKKGFCLNENIINFINGDNYTHEIYEKAAKYIKAYNLNKKLNNDIIEKPKGMKVKL